MRRLRTLGVFACSAALSAWLGAQDAGPLNPSAPLLRAVAQPSPAASAIALAAAQRAHDAGMPLLAADLYRQVRDIPGVDRSGITLKLTTALLDAGRAQEAEQVLNEVPEPRGAAWHLRMGLAAIQLRKVDVARGELAAIVESELPEMDHPWYWFLQGAIVDHAPVREISRANDFYLRAEKAAPTELARAVFQLAAERVRLRQKEAVDPKVQLDIYERNRGTRTGFEAAETHAVALDALGRKGEAVAFLQSVLVPLQRQQGEWWDRLRLVLGLIGDRARNGAGRNALNQLVESGSDPLRQRQALQLLAAASTAEQERKLFRDLLNKLIAAKPDHPIKESLLFYRAQLSLVEKDFLQAEADANALHQQFPRSPLRVHAFGVLTQSAWEQRRFRSAADFAQKALAGLETVEPSPSANIARARADLAVLVAEAWFRAGLAIGDKTDFRQSADAYAVVLRDHAREFAAPKVGPLMFQRVLAEIKAGSGEAGKVLDELARDPRFDLEHRWQAEWSLARALQLQGDAGVNQAYARVNTLVRDSPAPDPTLKPELRARMAWLQARLAFETNEHETAIRLVDALVTAPFQIDAALKTEISSEAVLLKAQAQFALGREADALKTLAQLREDYRKTAAATSSFIIESEHYAAQDKIDQARNRLISLIDDPEYNKTSKDVPYALYRLALLSERLGREENLLEANKRIEDLVENPAARGEADLIFAARMKQGDIFRKLNDFPRAQRAFEDLVNRYNRRPDVVFAQLALAETHNAQSSTDPAHLENAERIFEQLRDRVDAPADVRVEAGYNLGKLLERRGRLADAARVWWEIMDAIPGAASGATGPYWLARSLRDLGDMFEKQGRIEEAVKAYQQILERRLPYGAALATARLAQLGAIITKPATTP